MIGMILGLVKAYFIPLLILGGLALGGYRLMKLREHGRPAPPQFRPRAEIPSPELAAWHEAMNEAALREAEWRAAMEEWRKTG